MVGRIGAIGGIGLIGAGASGPPPVPLFPPINTVAPVITGTAAVGSVLACSLGTWSPAGTSYARQWRRDGVAISGATGASYTPVAGDKDKVITCVVTATNEDGSASQVSNARGPVTLSVPAVTSVTETGTTGMPYGPAAGGIGVTITGTNLTGATAVTFGGTPATSVVVVNATTITCVIPAKAAGVQNCVVVAPGGSSAPVNFTYLASASLSGNVILVSRGATSSSGTRTGGAAQLRHGTYSGLAPGSKAYSIPAPGPFAGIALPTMTGMSPGATFNSYSSNNSPGNGEVGFYGGFFDADGWSAAGGRGEQDSVDQGSWGAGLGGATTGGNGATIGSGAGVGNGKFPGGGGGGSWSVQNSAESYTDGPGHAGGAGMIKFSYPLGSGFATGGVKTILKGHVVHTLTAASGNVVVF